MSNLNHFLVKKNYILDTNVLLHDPNSLLKFEDNNVLLPIEVIEEIDRFKRESTELGQNARSVSRMLDGFRGAGRLSEGVVLPNGGQLRIIFQRGAAARNGHAVFSTNSVDNRILSLAVGIKKSQPKSQTILVSKDINLRIKADALGLLAEDYENDRVLIKDLYTGMIDLTVPAAQMASFRANGELELNGGQQYFPNEYCTLSDETNTRPKTLRRSKPRPSSPASVTAQKLSSPATLIKSTIPTWIRLPMGLIMSSADSGRSRWRRTLNCKEANGPNWRSWRRIFCEGNR